MEWRGGRRRIKVQGSVANNNSYDKDHAKSCARSFATRPIVSAGAIVEDVGAPPPLLPRLKTEGPRAGVRGSPAARDRP